jgi:hypothetical protein
MGNDNMPVQMNAVSYFGIWGENHFEIEGEIEDLTFDECYNLMARLGYFRNITDLGKLMVSFDDGITFIDFVPNPGMNRHFVVCLASYISSNYHLNLSVKIYCDNDNEEEDRFVGVFSGNENKEYQCYLPDTGCIIYFKF